MTTLGIAIVAVLVLIVLIVGWLVGIYNRLVRLKAMTAEAWSGIDVQLKLRHDLIPNLVKTVEGYSQHERTLLDNIAKSRSQSISAPTLQAKVEAENQLTQGLRQLFAVAEAYPDLKANQNFLDLQGKLSGVEDQLQLARRYYNGTVREYNVLVGSFPSSMIASRYGFTAATFFEGDQADKAVPEVAFAKPA